MATGSFDKLISRGRFIMKMFNTTEAITAGIPDGTLRAYNDGTHIYLQSYSLAVGSWELFNPADVVTAEIDADITTHAAIATAHHSNANDHAESHTVPSHSGTPGGELGGTWTTPTVDATHSGSAHHAESHTVASHSDTTGTGTELNSLTDGSNADSLHVHSSMKKTSGTGYFPVPSLSAGAACQSGSGGDDYGAYQTLTADAGSAVFIVGITCGTGGTTGDYLQARIATGGTPDVVAVHRWENTSSKTFDYQFPFPIPVPDATAIKVQVADDLASAVTWGTTLILIDQADLVNL